MKSLLTHERLTEFLLKTGRIKEAQLQDLATAARHERKSIFQLLTEREFFQEDEILELLSDYLKIPTLKLSALRIPRDLVKLIPKKIAERYQVLPVSRLENFLTVATSNPFDLMLKDDLKGLTHCEICFVLASSQMIASAIEACYGESSNLEELLRGIEDESLEVVRAKDETEKDEMPLPSIKVREAPVVRMVNLILDEGIRLRASDIHFEPYEKNFRVRYRIDGALKESFAHSRDLYPALVARIKIMSLLDMTQKRLPQDGRFRARIEGRQIDFRVSLLPTYHGEKIVLRVLDRSGVKTGIEKLGFTENATRRFSEAIQRPYGMILVTGPTGSGKSTTLYSILNALNTPDRNIMTIEDPVEYQVIGITQTQVQPEVGLTFASGLRALLRQSPDVVLVGEIRDTETADIAVKAALTGHLVFSTLHTNSAAGAVTRLMDMGVEPFLISSSLLCVAAQRLLRRICETCKTPAEVPEDLLRRCHFTPEEIARLQVYKGKGCTKCNQTGYFGRMAAIEVLSVSPQIRELILQQKSSAEIEQLAIQEGMETLFQNALGLFKQGKTTLEEVLRVTSPEPHA